MSNKINLLNLNEKELGELVVSLGMKKFYGKQIFTWLNQKIVRDINDMTNISLKDREILMENTYIPFLNLLKHQVSKKDKTEKYLFKLADGNTIESVILRHKDRTTLCISSQVGCAVSCGFCATGMGGFTRNLEVNEIVNQFYTIERRLSKQGLGINNIVFMGMGEPLLNLDNVIKAIEILSSENGVNISKRRITISTSGIVPGIERLLEEKLPVELAISLHCAIDEKRSEIMPINKKYPLEDLFPILQEYQKQTKRRISFEYILINDFNVSETDAAHLADFVHNFDHVLNLIPINPVEGTDLQRPSQKKIDRFYGYLKDFRKVNVTIRGEKGTDIDGACGQLRQKNSK